MLELMGWELIRLEMFKKNVLRKSNIKCYIFPMSCLARAVMPFIPEPKKNGIVTREHVVQAIDKLDDFIRFNELSISDQISGLAAMGINIKYRNNRLYNVGITDKVDFIVNCFHHKPHDTQPKPISKYQIDLYQKKKIRFIGLHVLFVIKTIYSNLLWK
jgi:hypothetical protein